MQKQALETAAARRSAAARSVDSNHFAVFDKHPIRAVCDVDRGECSLALATQDLDLLMLL